MSWFGNSFDAASSGGGESANALANAFNTLTTQAGKSFETYQNTNTQVELAKLKQGNMPVTGGGGPIPQQGFGMNTRSLVTVAGGALAVFFLYKFAKKNKWL